MDYEDYKQILRVLQNVVPATSTTNLTATTTALNGVVDMVSRLTDIGQGKAANAHATWAGFAGAFTTHGSLPASVRNAFITDFKNVLGILPSSLGDWAPANGIIGQIPSGGDFNGFIDKIFDGAFQEFISSYTFDTPYSVDNFVNAWGNFLTARGNIQAPGSVAFSNLTHYEAIYNEFVTNPSPTDFQNTLTKFIIKTYQDTGYFLPSHFLAEWLTTVKDKEAISMNAVSSVTGTKSFETRVLFDLFKLLVTMIEVLQKIAATQGQRLTFYANYQKAYTDLIAKVPVFSRDLLGRINDTNADKKSQLMGTLSSKNQALTESLRAYRSAIGDEAKQHQLSLIHI